MYLWQITEKEGGFVVLYTGAYQFVITETLLPGQQNHIQDVVCSRKVNYANTNF